MKTATNLEYENLSFWELWKMAAKMSVNKPGIYRTHIKLKTEGANYQNCKQNWFIPEEDDKILTAAGEVRAKASWYDRVAKNHYQ